MGELFTTACTRIEGRPTRLYREEVRFMCNAVRRGGAGAHTWRIHCLARSSIRLPEVAFLADREYSCGLVSGLRGAQGRVHGLKCRGYEALWASATHSPRVAFSGGSPTLPCASPILECDRSRSPRYPCESGLVPDRQRGKRGRATVERKLPRLARGGSTEQR